MGRGNIIGCVWGLLLGGSLVSWGAPAAPCFAFSFQQGSTNVSLSLGDNEGVADRLQGEFAGDRFSRVKRVVVVGLVDSEGNYRANLAAARARAEAVADFMEERYSWVFADGRLPLSIEVQEGVGTTRSVRVELGYHELTPLIATAPALSEAPQQVAEEQGVLILPPTRKIHTKPFAARADVLDENFLLMGIKTNLLYDAVLALNIELELPIKERWSIMASLVVPAWNFSNRYCLRVLETAVEGRYWFPTPTDRMTGHFVGLYAHFIASYDVQWGLHGVMGSGYGFGVTYGYAHRVGRHLGFEYSLGVGGVYLDHKRFVVREDYLKRQLEGSSAGWYFFPTRAKVSLVWRIGGQKSKKR